MIAGLATASQAGQRNGNQGGLFGAATFSTLNHTMASLQFIAPLLLPIVVAHLAAAIASSDRDWGTLRYLYIAPVSRSRLVAGKVAAVAVASITATLCVLVVHYWQNWTALFDPHGTTNLGTGLVSQIATIVVATGVAVLVLLRRDPAA